ncbi:MAG TPA: hypothetical protein VHX17_12680 [Candidatus Cybelea sp.]|nr:hypothetical protein [Candidatus Cybelea sp.]
MFTSALASAVAIGVLAGCSGGLGNSVPSTGAQSLSPAGRPALHMVGVSKDTASCPTAKYFTCVTVSKGSPASIEVCISSSGSCSSGSFPPYSWKQKIVTLKGKKFKSIVGAIKPKTGNPITDTITEKKKVKSSKGKVKYAQDIVACPTSGSCLDGAVGIVTQ